MNSVTMKFLLLFNLKQFIKLCILIKLELVMVKDK